MSTITVGGNFSREQTEKKHLRIFFQNNQCRDFLHVFGGSFTKKGFSMFIFRLVHHVRPTFEQRGEEESKIQRQNQR